MLAKPRLSEHLKDDRKSNYRSSKTTERLCPLYVLYCSQHEDIIILPIIYATSFSGVGGNKEKNPKQKNCRHYN